MAQRWMNNDEGNYSMAIARKRKPKRAPSKAARLTKRARASQQGAFPSRIYALASPKSVGGVSLFEAGIVIDSTTVANFDSRPEDVERAVHLLRDAGFEVLSATLQVINFSGTRETFESAFNTTLITEERETIKELGRKDKATFIDCPDTSISGLISTVGTRFEDVLEGVALEEPRYLMAPPLPFPPTRSYWHLDVPAGVSLACNADRAHRTGITGRGVRVAMVDTGWFKHPFFTERGYRAAAVTLGPGTTNPLADEVGHGTGESANIFAVAPDAELLPVKAMLGGTLGNVLVNVTAAFNLAVGLSPDVITNSWGFSIPNGPLSAAQQALAAAIAAAVASGITVVFSAGNGHWGFPGQHPDVISAGGAFIDRDGSLRASDYASGFMSNVYPGRRVPDVSGLVGMRPKAAYLMLPVEPNDEIDRGNAGGTHPNGDETPNDDGWAAFSGTSAAAPQVAGAVALLKQAAPRLTPAEVRDILMRTARDVTTGRNHPNFDQPAVAGPDTATGNGLIDVHRAVLVAKLRAIATPTLPLGPIRPVRPVVPLLPVRPVVPLLPVRPVVPLLPVRPVVPLLPLRPITPVRPLPEPGPLHTGLTAEELTALEELVIQSGEAP
jgi:Subtilase family